ncbi:MAG: hypothetical protein KAI40_03375 [Desulfobacterales bacterium]|nr:hypothetical protein [Desulfobacterales bacterium]
MNSFLEDMADDLDDVFINTDEFAQTINYYNGSATTQIDAVVTFGNDGQQFKADFATIIVKKADASAPAYGHTFEIEGAVFKISNDIKDAIVSFDQLTWEIKTAANERLAWRT